MKLEKITLRQGIKALRKNLQFHNRDLLDTILNVVDGKDLTEDQERSYRTKVLGEKLINFGIYFSGGGSYVVGAKDPEDAMRQARRKMEKRGIGGEFSLIAFKGGYWTWTYNIPMVWHATYDIPFFKDVNFKAFGRISEEDKIKASLETRYGGLSPTKIHRSDDYAECFPKWPIDPNDPWA